MASAATTPSDSGRTITTTIADIPDRRLLLHLGTAAGGISGPLLFADLTGTGRVADTVLAFQIGAGLMCAAGLVAALPAVRAERRSLEDIARPLTTARTAAP